MTTNGHAILTPATAADSVTRDFPSGSSPLTEKEALGHLSDKLGEITDGLRALAFRSPLRKKTLRQTLAHVQGNMTMARDSLRAVALLRGNAKWLDIAKSVEQLRDSLSAIETQKLSGWPTHHLLAIAGNFAVIKDGVLVMKDMAEKGSVAVSRGGVLVTQ